MQVNKPKKELTPKQKKVLKAISKHLDKEIEKGIRKIFEKIEERLKFKKMLAKEYFENRKK